MPELLKLIHASRLLLDEPVVGAGALSGEERRMVEDATITAFHRIVESCVDRRADLLILTGDTFDETSFTLRARATLLDGLETLADAGVSVFVTPGTRDSATAWRRLGHLPDAVTVFSSENESPVEITDRGHLLAVISCLNPSSRSIGTPGPSKPGVVQIGIIPEGDVPPGPLEGWIDAESNGWHYLAIGGGDRSQSLRLSQGLAHAPGTPQPLRSTGLGSHGCAFIEIDPYGGIHHELIRTATLRWERVGLDCSTSTSWEELVERMALHLLEYETSPVETLWNIEWVLGGKGDVFDSLSDLRRQRDLWDAIDRDGNTPGASVRRRHTLTREPFESGREHEAANLLQEFSETIGAVLAPQEPFWAERAKPFADLTSTWGRQLATLVHNADTHKVAEEARRLARGWWT